MANVAAARRVGNSIYRFLKIKLRLPINREKSGIRRPSQFYMLGYGFVPVYLKGVKGRYQLVVDISALKRLKEKIKSITRKTIPASFDERITRLNRVLRGWINYFPDALGCICMTNCGILMYGYTEGFAVASDPGCSGEETKPQDEESYPVGYQPKYGLCMEPDANGRMGSGLQSDTGHNHYLKPFWEKGIYFFAIILS